MSCKTNLEVLFVSDTHRRALRRRQSWIHCWNAVLPPSQNEGWHQLFHAGKRRLYSGLSSQMCKRL